MQSSKGLIVEGSVFKLTCMVAGTINFSKAFGWRSSVPHQWLARNHPTSLPGGSLYQNKPKRRARERRPRRQKLQSFVTNPRSDILSPLPYSSH